MNWCPMAQLPALHGGRCVDDMARRWSVKEEGAQ